MSTTRVTHATPASLYAHSASRYWEDDSLLPVEEAAKGCVDIAVQLLTEGRDIQVYYYVNADEYLSVSFLPKL